LSAVASPMPTSGPTSTIETGITITVGGAGMRSTGAAKSGVLGRETASLGEVVGISLLCSLILLFL
jgi:hypothetical protein